jgi:hypothetical protein
VAEAWWVKADLKILAVAKLQKLLRLKPKGMHFSKFGSSLFFSLAQVHRACASGNS